jgi:hypothetical protein
LYKKTCSEDPFTDIGQLKLGKMHLDGLATRVTYTVAKYWFEKAFTNGNTDMHTYMDNVSRNIKVSLLLVLVLLLFHKHV